MYGVWTRVIKSIIKLHTIMFRSKAWGEQLTPYQSEDPNPTTPTHRIKEESGKTAGDKK